ncbi:hypothetical protein TL16_g02266 [Triparma laevis f. inornata]|uniref:Uncharacterized protein n=1 Tax=Triparma laevis f. inornata TaxID=1714386 RepID=A0A9W6ZRE1_9STRA|nr:hypothetical protein TL16_g02266 [Triparma laevis f. inornata]
MLALAQVLECHIAGGQVPKKEKKKKEPSGEQPTPPSSEPPSNAHASPRHNKIDEVSKAEDTVGKLPEKAGSTSPISKRETHLNQKLPDKAVNLTGDDTLEKMNLEHINEADKEKLSTKAAALTGSGTVLKKKLRNRFGSEIHKENKDMQKAVEKYERLKKESFAGYLKGTAGEMKIAMSQKMQDAKKHHQARTTVV